MIKLIIFISYKIIILNIYFIHLTIFYLKYKELFYYLSFYRYKFIISIYFSTCLYCII